MKQGFKHAVTLVAQACLGLSYVHVLVLYAALPLAGILYALFAGWGAPLAWWQWVALAPVLYITWLDAFLVACAIEMQLWRPVTGFQKPRRATNTPGDPQWLRFFQVLGLYLRQRAIWSLPLVQSYMFVPGLRHFVLWSYAPRVRISRTSVVLGCLFDPDLTEVGDECIIGVGSTICAHSFNRNPDGTAVYVSAPVVIGPRTVVGGNARVDPGVRIGADAIVEPSSYVPAFTSIGDGEVWGGNPARFIRLRAEPSTESARDTTAAVITDLVTAGVSHRDHDHLLREIVAEALDRPVDSVTDDLSRESCAAWDSLGQLAIALGLRQKLGLVVSNSDSLRLRSMADLRALLT